MDDVTLVVAGQAFGGWQQIRVTRGIERMPSDFDIVLTELYPGQASQIPATPGQSCSLRIGADTVVTGYIDRYSPGMAPERHDVRIQGRGKCQDLVDCSAGIRKDGSFSAQISAGTALKIAQDLADPFGITVSRLHDEAGSTIPQFNLNLGETPFEIIDRVSRYRKLLAYEAADGNLILAQVGQESMASGFTEGVNIEEAASSFAMDGRFSSYDVVWTSTDSLRQVRDATTGTNGNTHGHAADSTVPRFRPRVIVSEQIVDGRDIGQDRAEWEMNRRNGRSQSITLTCDSWRDSAGRLWEPNTLAPIVAPHLKLPNMRWVIAEVTYRRGEDGTHADLTLMPPEAFQIQPSTLQGVDWQVFKALDRQGAASATPGPGGLLGGI
ncbi:phage baseplate assembly protein [Roseomonas elaeocarpi]|uniref:Phage baseplate assembly protein n=1 Tax=Roseomonas elaeocarpi TaxID=907779 RepID=A0ABV6JRJ2_9PROT